MTAAAAGAHSGADFGVDAPAGTRMPTCFLPHGGGPCFFMEWTMGPPDTFKKLEHWLRQFVTTLPARPKAVLIVSGHWETPVPTVGSGVRPALIYDYYGFPEHTYHLRYDVPGSPDLAERVQRLIAQAGIPVGTDPSRGLDHGVFVPLKVALPDADIPVVPLSLAAGLDPALHLAVGRALAPLRDDGVLILGSGMSWHNMRGFTPAYTDRSIAFDKWLSAAMTEPEEREAALRGWADGPFAQDAHPREEHLAPLFVVAGAASGEAGHRVFHDQIMNVAISAFQFGDLAPGI